MDWLQNPFLVIAPPLDVHNVSSLGATEFSVFTQVNSNQWEQPKRELLVHTSTCSCLGYCNSLFTGITQSSLARLQPVQNSTAMLSTNIGHQSHINPVLASLHWLPVKHRINFKIVLTTYKALNGLATAYITELLSSYSCGRPLWSSD